MKSTTSLPVVSCSDPAHAKGTARMPNLRWRERKGPILHPSPLADNPGVLSLNLSAGCVHRCAFCSARAYSGYPGDDVLYLYRDLAQQLDAELADKRDKPRAVYISPSTDPFPPLLEVQAETVRVVDVLARHGVEAWLMTRGFIRPTPLRALATRREFVRITVGLTTLDRKMQRVLEPLAAPPRMRLRQIAQLRKLGIPVRVALEPLVPGLTDTRENLAELLPALAKAGVQRVSAGYMFLRQRIRDNLVEALAPHGWERTVLEAFDKGPVLENGRVAAARYLPKARRQRGYAGLMALAAEVGITVCVNDLTNPDFRPPRPVEVPITLRQPLLF